MSQTNLPYIIVVGNEKGGAGKTTLSMHLICGLLDRGLSVSSMDVDCRQHSLTRYIQNRQNYKDSHNALAIQMPKHFLLELSNKESNKEKEEEERANFEKLFEEAKNGADIVVIDTPGSHTFLSNLAHSYADIVVTPINDSFIDLDVMAKVDEHGKVISPSIYSQTIWEQKMERAKRDGKSIEWFVTRNRLSSLDAKNKRNVCSALEELSKRIGFHIIEGFNERVIFKELFLQGLTLLDLKKINYDKPFSLSHVAARQELRNFLEQIGIEEIIKAKESVGA